MCIRDSPDAPGLTGLSALANTPKGGSLTRRRKGTVSYTHLDVYKRQLGVLVGVAFTGAVVVSALKGVAVVLYKAGTILPDRSVVDGDGCLLYTSRCV